MNKIVPKNKKIVSGIDLYLHTPEQPFYSNMGVLDEKKRLDSLLYKTFIEKLDSNQWVIYKSPAPYYKSKAVVTKPSERSTIRTEYYYELLNNRVGKTKNSRK